MFFQNFRTWASDTLGQSGDQDVEKQVKNGKGKGKKNYKPPMSGY